MRKFLISPDFQTKQSRDAAAAAAAGKPSDLVFLARARAFQARRSKRVFGALALLAAPVLAVQAHRGAGQLPAALAPAEIPVAGLTRPAASLPHIVTQRGPAQAKIAPEGIDFTATSATEPDESGASKRLSPKPPVRRKKQPAPK
ncbi:hypothetical protein [Methylocystis parvus]|uniref:Uncharacterized protein n=1 Tax=Methylocystis parvus TaxID=134 RepID=A0A6B8M153_9HYPH|nr:hypothetical protein [Methylocystis parvus]QGM96591.1 hypothetical protein F7D14_03220 [Methylocystis parvus]WBJ99554.1 hypothetical protein MMG94_16410 [Methylocystis parvus OBBP]